MKKLPKVLGAKVAALAAGSAFIAGLFAGFRG